VIRATEDDASAAADAPGGCLPAASTDSESGTALYTWMAATVRPCTHGWLPGDLIGSLETDGQAISAQRD